MKFILLIKTVCLIYYLTNKQRKIINKKVSNSNYNSLINSIVDDNIKYYVKVNNTDIKIRVRKNKNKNKIKKSNYNQLVALKHNYIKLIIVFNELNNYQTSEINYLYYKYNYYYKRILGNLRINNLNFLEGSSNLFNLFLNKTDIVLDNNKLLYKSYNKYNSFFTSYKTKIINNNSFINDKLLYDHNFLIKLNHVTDDKLKHTYSNIYLKNNSILLNILNNNILFINKILAAYQIIKDINIRQHVFKEYHKNKYNNIESFKNNVKNYENLFKNKISNSTDIKPTLIINERKNNFNKLLKYLYFLMYYIFL